MNATAKNKIQYASLGLIKLSHKAKAEFTFLAAMCKADKIEAIDLFMQDDILCVCGLSYLTNVYFMMHIKTLQGDLKAVQDVDNRGLVDIEGSPILDITKPVVRVGTTSDVLSALALYGDGVSVEVQEHEVVTRADGTILFFDVIRTMSEYTDYLDKCVRKDISEMSVDKILNMTHSLFRIKEDVYRRHVMLSGGQAYTHTSSFLAECTIAPVKYEYLLRYHMLAIIDKLPKKIRTTIGYRVPGMQDKRGQFMVLKVGDCYVSWDLSGPIEENLSNLMNILNRNHFSHVLSIAPPEWSKLDVLVKYADKSESTITIMTRSEGIFAFYGKNKTYIRGNFQPGVSFDVELELLKQARTLTGHKQPEVYVDYTGKQNILILKGDILVTIAVTKLKVDSSGFKFAKTLEEIVPVLHPTQPVIGDKVVPEGETSSVYIPMLGEDDDDGFDLSDDFDSDEGLHMEEGEVVDESVVPIDDDEDFGLGAIDWSDSN